MGSNRLELQNDLESSLLTALDGRQVSIWTALPCIVTKVNFAAMTIECQPAIQGIVTNSNGVQSPVNLPLLVDVPICFPSAGGFTLTLPIMIGDEVLVIFSSRCIDAWWQLGGIQPPLEYRLHDLSDGFAIPGPKSVPNIIGSISSTGAQLRNNAGTAYLEISADGKIRMVASEIDITGSLKVSGEVTAGTIPLTAHIHPGVTSGGSDTGAPLP